jgi:hypothetical protein
VLDSAGDEHSKRESGAASARRFRLHIEQSEVLMRRLGSCLLTAVALLSGVGLMRLSTAADRPAAAPAGVRKPAEELCGAGSCAAAACHNANGARGSKGSEYTTWVTDDPHARAVEVLYGEKSLQIEKRRKRTPRVEAEHPESDPLCLNCHVMPGIRALDQSQTGGPPQRETFALGDGVSCEACHGAAGGWLTQHYTADWRARTPEQKSAEGLRSTKNLRVQVEVCVRCHVGEGNIDVNHDLIAAGHPRLNFEYAAYLANLPKHWDDKKDKADHPDFEARAWAIGQVVSAQASLELLAHRSNPLNKRQRWPEFAEYDCFACHHDLAPESWRSQPQYVKRRLWVPAWNTWYVSPALDSLAKAQAEGQADALTKQLGDLRTAMGFFSSDRANASKGAGAAAKSLAGWLQALEKTQFDPERLKPLTATIEAGWDRDLHECTWDQAVQYYLALAAMRQALLDRQTPLTRATQREYLIDLRCKLGFPCDYDSPRGLDPVTLPKK